MDYIQSDSGIEGRYLNSGEMIFRKVFKNCETAGVGRKLRVGEPTINKSGSRN